MEKFLIPFISIIILNMIAFFIKKKISKLELFTTSIFALYFSIMTDVFLGLYLNLYHYYGQGIELLDYVIHFGFYPSVSIIFLNLYPYERSKLFKIMFVILASIIAVSLEGLYVKVGFFHYTGWKLIYSTMLYPFIYLVLLAHLKIIRKLY